MSPPRILALAGSARRESLNGKLARLAADAARDAGAEVTLIDLRDFPLPLYDGDLEASEGLPANALKLRDLFRDHDGLLLACPEYNSSITPLLKNTIDWVSRPAAGQPTLVAFAGKVAGLFSASTGALGGLRGLVTVRSILGNIRVVVIPEQMALPWADKAFDAEGALEDEAARKQVRDVAGSLVRAARALKGA